MNYCIRERERFLFSSEERSEVEPGLEWLTVSVREGGKIIVNIMTARSE